jgi:hypothetical protein
MKNNRTQESTVQERSIIIRYQPLDKYPVDKIAVSIAKEGGS